MLKGISRTRLVGFCAPLKSKRASRTKQAFALEGFGCSVEVGGSAWLTPVRLCSFPTPDCSNVARDGSELQRNSHSPGKTGRVRSMPRFFPQR